MRESREKRKNDSGRDPFFLSLSLATINIQKVKVAVGRRDERGLKENRSKPSGEKRSRRREK